MVTKIVLVDFAGTLVKASVIEEANLFRAEILKRHLPGKEEHANPEELYKNNRDCVKRLCGVEEDMRINYRTNDLTIMQITGEELQNQIATNLFQIGMFKAAQKYKQDIVPEGLIEQLQQVQAKGYKLAIVSGVRNDIISGMLEIAEVPIAFDYIFSQPPILGISNEENMVLLQEQGHIEFVLGDKYSDLEAGKAVGAQAIFVTWGHASGNEEEIADFTISDPHELDDIIQ